MNILNIFVDYTQAFDSVAKNKILDCLKQYKAPPKIIKLITMTLINNRIKIKISNNFSEEFTIESGVK
jgi:hypothetical protein